MGRDWLTRGVRRWPPPPKRLEDRKGKKKSQDRKFRRRTYHWDKFQIENKRSLCLCCHNNSRPMDNSVEIYYPPLHTFLCEQWSDYFRLQECLRLLNKCFPQYLLASCLLRFSWEARASGTAGKVVVRCSWVLWAKLMSTIVAVAFQMNQNFEV